MAAMQESTPLHPLSVRMSPFYLQRLDRIVASSGTWKNKTQVVRAALQFANDALDWSRRGRLVVRSLAEGRQVGVHVGPGAEESNDGEQGAKSASLRLNLSDTAKRRVQRLKDAEFAPDQSAVIRRAILLLDEVLQYRQRGWLFGWLEATGRFHEVSVPGASVEAGVTVDLEDESDYERARRQLDGHVLRLLPDLVRKARYAQESVEEVVDEFVDVAREHMFSLQVFDQCATVKDFLDASLRMVEEYDRATSVILAIESVQDLETHFRPLLLEYARHQIKTFILHHDEAAVSVLVSELYRQAADAGPIEEQVHFVMVDPEFFRKKPQTVIFDLHSSTLRCGYGWFVSGDERQGTSLTPDKIRAFFDQVGPRIESAARRILRGGRLSEPVMVEFDRAGAVPRP